MTPDGRPCDKLISIVMRQTVEIKIESLRLGDPSKKKHCIFHDIWQKARGSTDQNQISEKNQNMDKFLEGVGEKICCYNLKSLIFCF